ncbi:DUF3631 domain-containing protein [Mesorhizobium sp.]|uniref:DUF3631 domain-containing protein n=1 Tax=Mesorhizobium sp. TaxID=1871066 RepID=UPI000FE660A0|nr:DUF3631 domain-containing protein [Mesorhizobium sp.]RWA80834.1 MAG: DUF3631 domain-containing protein [Mesorhizobium sp.]
MTIETDFLHALKSTGLGPAVAMTPCADGKLHRFRLHDERAGKRSGWYVLHDGAIPHGHAGDWRSGERVDWFPTSDRDGKIFDEAAWKAQAERRQDERERGHEEAARKAKALWDRLPPARENHPYLMAKKVAAGPARVMANGALVLPVMDATTDAVTSLQFVAPDGGKRFLSGGRIKAGCCRIGPADNDRTILCEGFATAMSLHAATGYPVVAAFSAGNLLSVADALREKTRGLRLVIAADNDTETPGNPGITKALEASLLTGVPWIAPPRPGDFNDLAIAYGNEAVALVIEAATDVEAKKQLDAMFGPSKEPLEAVYERLAKLELGAYDRIRTAEAKRLGIRAVTLDAEVARRRKVLRDEAEGRSEKLSGRAIGLYDPEPADDAQDGLQLLEDLLGDLRRHVVLSDAAAAVTAFYVLFAYTYEAFSHCPRLSVVAPTKNSGKSTLADWLTAVLPRAIPSENLTVSTLFRIVDRYHATMIIDEADKLLVARHDGASELIIALNAGWKRPGLHLRTEGDAHEPRAYSVFGPAVMSGIGDRPPQLTERSHRIVLRRATKQEFRKLERLRADRVEPQRLLARRCARWARDHARDLAGADPDLPAVLANRSFVNWFPLIAIGDLIGGAWPQRLRAIAEAAAADYDDDELGVELLRDIRAIFEAEGDHLTSATLAGNLAALEGRPWAEYGRSSKPISANSIARLLKPFKIFPGDIWVPGTGSRKGYTRALFEGAWKLYLDGENEEENTSTRPDHSSEPRDRETSLFSKGSGHFSNREDDTPPRSPKPGATPSETYVPRGLADEHEGAGGNGHFSHLCDQCGADSGGPDGMASYTYGDRIVHLHGSCLHFWQRHNREHPTVKIDDL